MPRAPSLRSMFLAWVCFSLAFSTVFQAFLTTFLVDSGYETPIQNMEELFASGIKFAYTPEHNYIFLSGDETDSSYVQRNLAICPSFDDCVEWANNERNVSVLLSDLNTKICYSTEYCFDEKSEPFICSLKDGVFFHTGLVMLMLHADPLLRRVNEIIGRVVEAGMYNYWLSLRIHMIKLYHRKKAIVQPLDEYYSFNPHHMQAAFYLILMGWCLSALCFMVELLYNRLLRKKY
jgi:hypothetical protein